MKQLRSPQAYTDREMPKKKAARKRAQKSPRENAKKKPATSELKGWTAIAAFLAIPASAARRWARDGMPVRRQGRFTVAKADELRAWLGRESHMRAPALILTDESDVAGALKESIAATRRSTRKHL